jgi:hypothetical protein
MNEGWTKDERRIIEGCTALIWLRYGSDMTEVGRRFDFNMVSLELSIALSQC